MFSGMLRDYDPYDFSELDYPYPSLDSDFNLLGLGPLNDSLDFYSSPFRSARRRPPTNIDRKNEREKFQVMLNVKHFRPDEIDVKTVENFVVIHGKHEEQADQHGFVSREFTRRYKLPEDVEPDTVTSSLSQDGILRIQAPRKQLEPPPKNERVIPIKIQRSAVVEMAEEQKQQQQQSASTASTTSEEPKQ